MSVIYTKKTIKRRQNKLSERKIIMSELKSTLNWMNGKLDTAEEKASEIKTIITETVQVKQKKKLEKRNRKSVCCRTSHVIKSPEEGEEKTYLRK